MAIGPVLWIFSMSLKTQREFIRNPFGIPRSILLENYLNLINDVQIIAFFKNSIFITLFSMIIVLTFGALASYAISRITFKGRELLFILFLIGNTIPIISVVVPLFILVHSIGLGGSRWSIIFSFVAMNLGVTVLILRGFFRSIPKNIEEAAMLDGCNIVQLVWFIMIPIIKPGLFVAASLNFIAFWNEYYLVSIIADNQGLMTVPAGLAAKLINYHSTNWPAMAAGIILSVLPVILIFIIAQDRIIEGWSVSVK